MIIVRYHYRCSVRICRKRVTLTHPKDDDMRCPECNSDSLKPHFTERRKTRNRQNCWCDRYPWSAKGGPHSVYSKFCVNNPKGPRYTDDELEDHLRTVAEDVMKVA